MTRSATSTRSVANQCTGTVAMIRPHHFFSNPETAATNEFQSDAGAAVAQQAVAEFDGLVATLREEAIEVIVFDDTADPPTPDAVFPNNWLSTHADGTLITYPMQPPSRRLERRTDIVESLTGHHGFRMHRHLDLSSFEAREQFLEGTGSLVLDRVQRRAYACLSARTHEGVLARFADEMGYSPVTFAAFGPSGRAIYHTNVMMCVGRHVIVACVEAIAQQDRARVVAAMEQDHELVPISMAQMSAFAGNMLELDNADGEALLVMSARARAALGGGQVERLERHTRIVSAPIDAIEDAAGGSVRCMLAELFLPREL